jgi:hypothetical protein
MPRLDARLNALRDGAQAVHPSAPVLDPQVLMSGESP